MQMVALFNQHSSGLFADEDIARQRIAGEGRHGNTQLLALTTIAIGAMRVVPHFPAVRKTSPRWRHAPSGMPSARVGFYLLSGDTS